MEPMTNEQKALAVGNDRKELRKRLNAAKACLKAVHKKYFKTVIFDFENKRLIGNGHYLQWQLRNQPDLPESYDNQQTNCGTVCLYRDLSLFDPSLG